MMAEPDQRDDNGFDKRVRFLKERQLDGKLVNPQCPMCGQRHPDGASCSSGPAQHGHNDKPERWRIDIGSDESWELYGPDGTALDSGVYVVSLVEAISELVSEQPSGDTDDESEHPALLSAIDALDHARDQFADAAAGVGGDEPSSGGHAPPTLESLQQHIASLHDWINVHQAFDNRRGMRFGGCTSRRGHKWEARYGSPPDTAFERGHQMRRDGASEREAKDWTDRMRPYLGDICTRCGAERKGLVRSG